jgi:MerR family transcriptional regulator/heat shock protein HspR
MNQSVEEYISDQKLLQVFRISPTLLSLYEQRGLIGPAKEEEGIRWYPYHDVERVRLIRVLTRELGVNLAGVEVILAMRDRLLSMQEQMWEVYRYVQEQLHQR